MGRTNSQNGGYEFFNFLYMYIGNRPLGKRRLRSEDNVRMEMKESVLVMNGIEFKHKRGQWYSVV